MSKFALFLIVINAAGEESLFVVEDNVSFGVCEDLREAWKLALDEFSTVYCAREELYIFEKGPHPK